MKRTMVAFSVPGLDPARRYDFMALPSGTGYYRLQTTERRSRWKRIHVNLTNFVVNTSGDMVAGPALLEISDEEGRLIDAGSSVHPPRNVGLRAEKIRMNWKGGHVPVARLDSWLEDWRTAILNNDELWIKARTDRHGRTHQVSSAAVTNAVTNSALSTTAVPETVTASITISPAPATTESHSGFVYPELVKGSVIRPNGELYRVRRVGKKHDVHVFREMREERVHSLTFGQPGTGKSACMDAAFGSSMVTMMGSEDVEAADFEGSFVESDDGKWLWEDGPLPIAMENGWVLYIDEIGVIRQKQMSLLYSVMDGRDEIRITANPKRGIVRAAPGFAIVASTNPDSPEVRLTDALLSRFGFKLEVTSDYQMAKAHLGVPDWLVGAAENLETRRRSKELPWAPQTRDLLLWKKNCKVFDGDEVAASGVMVNSAPATARGTVADVLTKAAGKRVKPLVMT